MLAFVKQHVLPLEALPDLGDPIARLLRRRVINETAWTMRRHPDGRRYALFGLFLAHRERDLTDGLIDLLIDIVHKIGARTCTRLNSRPYCASCMPSSARTTPCLSTLLTPS